ncbi:MAG: GNAT family N-acetyltransferase [Phycisphaerales bacterium]
MTPPILTDRLALRAPLESDLDALMLVFGDPRVMRYIGDGTPRSREQVLERLGRKIRSLADHAVTIWTVETRVDLPAMGERPAIPTGTVVGDCGCIPAAWTGPEFELGYRLRYDAWGRGIATEAARAAAEHVFGVTELDRLVGLTFPENPHPSTC